MKTKLKLEKLKLEKFKIFKISKSFNGKLKGGNNPNDFDTLTHKNSTDVCNILLTND
jgi:hypothetical protein